MGGDQLPTARSSLRIILIFTKLEIGSIVITP
jgi:hypothetical protein